MKSFLEFLLENNIDIKTAFTPSQLSFILKKLKLPSSTRFTRLDPKTFNFKGEELANSNAPKFFYGSVCIWKLKDNRLAITKHTSDLSNVVCCGFFDNNLQQNMMNDAKIKKSVLKSLQSLKHVEKDTTPYADDNTLSLFTSSTRDSWSDRLTPAKLKTKCSDVFVITSDNS